jgi:lambda repressor-like predicted transcriptional regulator
VTYSPEQIEAHKATILERIAAKGESLRKICRVDGMPAASTVFLWLAEDEAFSEQYARAREVQADAMFDEILEIADQFDNVQDKLDVEHINRAKLRIDTRKWAVSKMAPKKYGEKVDLNHSGKLDGDITHHGAVAVRPFAEFLGEAIGRGASDIPGGVGEG